MSDERIEVVKQYYDDAPQAEWDRLERHPIEFLLNARFMVRYIKPGDKVLDIGGGPGRYSTHLAQMGCDVTLADLSGGNVAFAEEKARELGLPLCAVQANALDLSQFADGEFDHVLLMGPLYHLEAEADRAKAVREALRVLRPGGTLHCAFISSYGGIMWAMKCEPQSIIAPALEASYAQFIDDRPYVGISFTHSYFIRQQDVLPFMAQFPLEKLHLFGSEGLMSPCEQSFLSQPKDVFDAWVDLSEKVCERENLLSFAEHFQYVGRKR